MTDVASDCRRSAGPQARSARPLFDDGALFALIDQRLLPALVAARTPEQRLRLWSAGHGGEAYTLALLASARLASQPGWQLSVLGSEGDRSDGAPPRRPIGAPTPQQALREAGLQRAIGSAWTVAAAVRRLVEWVPIDLLQDVVPSLVNGTVATDLIVCRGALPRLSPADAEVAFGKLCRALAPDGYLLVDVPPPHPDGLVIESVAGHWLCRRVDVVRPTHDAIAVPQGDPASIHAQALLAYRQGDFAGVRALLDGAVGQGTASADMLALLARCEAVQGRFDEAAVWCERALAVDDRDPAQHCLRACLLQEQGAFGEAMQACKRALCLDPGFMLAHFGLGRLARRLGRHGEAERHFRNALALARRLPTEQPLAHADGLTAGRLAQLIAAHGIDDTAPDPQSPHG